MNRTQGTDQQKKPAMVKRAALLFSLLLLSATLCGCKAGAGTAAETSTTDGNSSEALQQPEVYRSADGWQITYQPEWFSVKEENGTVRFTCRLEETGADYFEISYAQGKLPREVLYEKIAHVDDSRITRTEGYFGNLKGDWSFTYLVAPAEGTDLHEQYDAIEHNGGTILIHSAYKTEQDEETAELICDTIADTMSSLTLNSHEPQQEFSYVPGTYERSYKEEIEGKEETVTDRIILNADHTGTVSFQDDIPLIWSSYELIMNDGAERCEYTVEGDSLLVNLGGTWSSFEKQ